VTTVQPSGSRRTSRRPAFDHGFDGKGHSGVKLETRAGPAIVQHLRILVVDPADAVSAVFSHHREIVAFGIGLDGMADVAQPGARLDHADAAPHGLVTSHGQPAGEYRGVADEIHAAGVAVESVANHRDIDIDDIPALELLVAGIPWHTTWFTEVQMVFGKPR